jgi:hypothetical protein
MAIDPSANPFAVLSLIVAPAVLTNASSVLIMSTSNRLARAVDRAQKFSAEVEEGHDRESEPAQFRLKELNAAEERSIMLMEALRSFYIALGGFACAAFLSLLGAVLFATLPVLAGRLLEGVAVVAGLTAVGGLIHGSVILLRETRIAVGMLRDRAERSRRSLPRSAG